MNLAVRVKVNEARNVVVTESCRAKNVEVDDAIVDLLCHECCCKFLSAVYNSCKGVSTNKDVDAYSLALLMICTPYYSINHGTVPKIGKMTFATIWSRISESASSSGIGVLSHKIISGRCCNDYMDMTRGHTTRHSVRTSKDKPHIVVERRRRISAMYSHTMGSVKELCHTVADLAKTVGGLIRIIDDGGAMSASHGGVSMSARDYTTAVNATTQQTEYTTRNARSPPNSSQVYHGARNTTAGNEGDGGNASDSSGVGAMRGMGSGGLGGMGMAAPGGGMGMVMPGGGRGRGSFGASDQSTRASTVTSSRRKKKAAPVAEGAAVITHSKKSSGKMSGRSPADPRADSSLAVSKTRRLVRKAGKGVSSSDAATGEGGKGGKGGEVKHSALPTDQTTTSGSGSGGRGAVIGEEQEEVTEIYEGAEIIRGTGHVPGGLQQEEEDGETEVTENHVEEAEGLAELDTVSNAEESGVDETQDAVGAQEFRGATMQDDAPEDHDDTEEGSKDDNEEEKEEETTPVATPTRPISTAHEGGATSSSRKRSGRRKKSVGGQVLSSPP